MKQYLKNLMRAFAGNDPFKQELDELKDKYAKATKNVDSLKESFFALNEKVDADEARLVDLVAKLGAAEKSNLSLQRLVENLRQRIAEKDDELERQGKDYAERMDRMKADYKKRIDEYNIAIDEMKKALLDKDRRQDQKSGRRQDRQDKRQNKR